MNAVDGARATVAGIPAMTWGPQAASVLLAVHGAYGDKQDATIRRVAGLAVPLGYQVVSVDLPGHGDRVDAGRPLPWRCVPELTAVHDALTGSAPVIDLFACSLGAYFSLVAFGDRSLGQALLLAPLVDMAAHIDRLMQAKAVSEERLRREETIEFADGQFLDWRYLTFAREHPVRWPHRTELLWGVRDELVPEADITRFAEACGAPTRRLDAGHAFTSADDAVVDDWLTSCLDRGDHGRAEPA